MKIKCPKCISARHVRTSSVVEDYFMCDKCKIGFKEEDSYQ